MGGVRGEGKQLCGHMSRFAFVLLAVVACDAELVGGVMPTARAKPFMALAPRNQDRVIKLLSEQYIPDGGEITWVRATSRQCCAAWVMLLTLVSPCVLPVRSQSTLRTLGR